MKTLKENMKTVATYASADTTNAENFPAWTPSDAVLLEQLAMTGTLGNSFYANAKEAAKEAIALLERADAQALAAAIVRALSRFFSLSIMICEVNALRVSKPSMPLIAFSMAPIDSSRLS